MKSFCIHAIAVGLVMAVTTSHAASITWSAPTKIAADTDVSLNGTLVRAANATPNGTSLDVNVTLNGVTFLRSPRANVVANAFTIPNGDQFVSIDGSAVGPGTFQAFGQGGTPFNTLSAAYSNLLCTAYWNDGTDIGNTWVASTGYDWTLNNLTSGRTYELQVWVNDSRLSNLGQNNPGLFTTFLDLNGNNVNLEHNVDNFLGGVGQFVIGTFTANATSQAVRLLGGNTIGADPSGINATSLLNAYQLRDITPTSAPVFTNAFRVGGNIILQGASGPANGAYQMLRSPDVTAPLEDDGWAGVGVKYFDASGSFSFTNAILFNEPTAFYRLRVLSSGPVFPPGITTQPQDLAIAVGQNAGFNVTATGSIPLTYQWYFNTNTPVAGGTNATLTITAAQLADAGKYSVTIANLAGSTNSSFATLTVTNSTAPPFIITPPASLTVVTGQTANFSVTAGGAVPLRYQWYFNTNTVLAGQTNSTLALFNATTNDAGTYSVTVTNLYGSTNSAFATLTVNTSAGSQLVGWAAVAGYGQTTTTGGGSATPELVTDLATLRTLAGDGTPRVLILSGTFVTGSSPISIASNKTLRGTNNATIQGGIDINTKSNIIVQNLNIQANGSGNTPVDAAAARTAHHLWFDHVSFSDAGDGLLDLTVGSDYITVSWCKFYYTDPSNTHRLCSLVGNGSTSTTDTNKNNVTYHHNWFSDLVDQRMPRLLFGKGHMFNNYYYAPGDSYCIGTGSWGSALIENNYFKQVNSPHQSQDGNPSYIAASGNIYDSCTGNQHTGLLNPDNDGNDPGPWAPPYSYTLAPAADVPGIVTLGAGPQ